MSSKILRKMRGEQVSIRQPECVAGHFAAPKTVRRSALWVPGFSIFSEEVVSSSGALCSALLGYYLFTRDTQYLLSASHRLLRNRCFLWSSSSHITNPAILHLHYMLRLQITAESLVYKQFYQLECL